jgi:hypothetical protein
MEGFSKSGLEGQQEFFDGWEGAAAHGEHAFKIGSIETARRSIEGRNQKLRDTSAFTMPLFSNLAKNDLIDSSVPMTRTSVLHSITTGRKISLIQSGLGIITMHQILYLHQRKISVARTTTQMVLYFAKRSRKS